MSFFFLLSVVLQWTMKFMNNHMHVHNTSLRIRSTEVINTWMFLRNRIWSFCEDEEGVCNFSNPRIFVSSWGFAVDHYSLPLKMSIISVCSYPRRMPSLLLSLGSKWLPKFLPFHSYAYWVIEYSCNGIAHHQFYKLSFDSSSQVHKKLSHWETRFINFLWWNKYIACTMPLLINDTLH